MGKYLTIFFLFIIISAGAQTLENDDFSEFKKAYLDMQNENYKDAYPYFKHMLELYPKEPLYNYYVGRCLLFLDNNPEKSLPYLRFASTKEVPIDVYFYLGIAYIRNYEFQKAVNSFMWFEKGASKKALKEINFQTYMSMAQNGLYLTKFIRAPLVYSKQSVNVDRLYTAYSMDGYEGYFTDKQEYFNEEKDSLEGQSVLFVPSVLENQDMLYFSGINKKNGSYDIYRVVRLTDTTWSEPENLGNVINTPFDENYPFMHSDGTTLYFASKGHYSMGGYDLYKSSWNWNTQQWSEPENLDFPINSPFDDILFVPSPNKKSAFFASNRDNSEGEVMVYNIKLTSSEPYIEMRTHSEMLKYARLDVNASLSHKENNDVSPSKYKANQDDIVKIKNREGFLYRSSYDSLLNLAMHYQLKADSLKWVIEEKRALLDNTKEGQDRALLSNSIIKLEREIYSLQKEADSCYERVREIEQANLVSKKTIYENANKQEGKEASIDSRNNRAPKVFIEPVIDSLRKSKLVAAEDEENEEKELMDLGLRVELPPVYNKENPIPQNETLPNEVIYMIQLGAFSSEKPPAVFNGLTPLSSIKAENSNIRKYFAGKFLHLAEAEKNLPTVKAKGFKDAYIVAFKGNSIIPVNKAISMESEEENLPVAKKKESKKEGATPKNDLSIIFVLKGEVDPNDSLVIEGIKSKLPENLDLYLERKNNKTTFLIKSFLSYENTVPVKNNVEAILKKQVEIHAYFAENQIPLEQARKITK